jgi:hypothetical protein
MKKLLLFGFFSLFLILAGCNDPNTVEPISNSQVSTLEKWDNLPHVVHRELQAVKAATAKYNDIKKALADGYVDIGVVIPNMGHHFLNPEYLDADFELTKPEILVYELRPNGKYKLVAVEYAVPLVLANVAPEGFTGSYDVWDVVPDAGIWALHAWVWKKNPLGVFNPTNPNVP